MIPSASQLRHYSSYQPLQNFSQFAGRNLITAVSRGHLHDVKKLLCDTSALTYVDADGSSPLHQAAYNGSTDIIEALLAQMQLKGISVDIENQDQMTPLMNAISAGRRAVVIRLLEAGAHVNHVDKSGYSPLHSAAAKGFDKIVQVLLDKGADCTLVTDKGETALNYARINGSKKIIRLIKSRDEAACQFSRITRQRKLLSHILELSGTTTLAHPSQNQKVTLQLTGWWHVDIWNLIVKRGADFFRGYPAIQEAAKCATSNASWTTRGIFDRYKSGKPVIINTGFSGHYASVILWGTYCIICNRGGGRNRKSCEAALINPQMIDQGLISGLRSLLDKSEIEYINFLNRNFPSRLIVPRPGSIRALLEEVMSLPWQKVGNCTWANAEAAIFALLVLERIINYPNGKFPSEKELEGIVNLQKQLFKAWQDFMIDAQVESYLRKATKETAATRLYTEDWDFLYRVEAKARLAFQDNELAALKLQAAVQEGSAENVSKLLEEGAPLDYVDGNGDTALHHAARCNRRKIAKILIYYGANLARVNKMGEPPLLQARKRGNKVVYRVMKSRDDDVLAYSKVVSRQKLLAQMLGITGVTSLAHPNKDQIMKVVVPLGGCDYREIWNVIVKRSQFFGSAVLEACKSATDDSYGNVEKLLDQYHQGKKPIIINVGYVGQYISAIVWGSYFVICNRDRGIDQRTSCEVFSINQQLINEDVICELREFQYKSKDAFIKFLNKKFPSRTSPPQMGTKKALLEHHMSLPWDESGDPAWANAEGAIYALFILQELIGRPHFPTTQELQALATSKRKIFEAWRENMIAAQVERYMQAPENGRYPRDWRFLEHVKERAPASVVEKIDRFGAVAKDLLASLEAIDVQESDIE